MNALKRVELPIEQAATSATAIRPKVTIKGDKVNRYVKACDSLKSAFAAKKETEQVVKDAGIDLVINTCLAHPDKPATTVEVSDETGAVAQVQFRAQYGSVEAEKVCAVFGSLRGSNDSSLDINDFVHETVQVSFDSSVFIVNSEFQQARYDAFKKAVDKVAAIFGVASPLSSKKVVTANSTFHNARWGAIPGFDQQKAIQDVMPATVAATGVKEGKVDALSVEPEPIATPVKQPRRARKTK